MGYMYLPQSPVCAAHILMGECSLEPFKFLDKYSLQHVPQAASEAC